MTIFSSLLLFASPKSLKLQAEKILTIVGVLQLKFDAFGFNFLLITIYRFKPIQAMHNTWPN